MGSACSVWTTLHLPQLTAPVLSRSTLLRLQVALQGNFPKRALGFVHFPGLSCSGSSSQVLHKAKTWLDMRFVPFPGPSRSGDQVVGKRTLPWWDSASYHLLHPSHSVSWVYSGSTVSGVPCVSSGELISGCDPPGGCQSSMTPGRLG